MPGSAGHNEPRAGHISAEFLAIPGAVPVIPPAPVVVCDAAVDAGQHPPVDVVGQDRGGHRVSQVVAAAAVEIATSSWAAEFLPPTKTRCPEDSVASRYPAVCSCPPAKARAPR